MKWYQVVECDCTVKNPLICNFSNLEEFGFSGNNFMIGKKILDWKNGIFFKAERDGDPDDALQNHMMIPIFSPRLMEELDFNKIDGIQYLNIDILISAEKVVSGFVIANITNFVSAFNYNKSVYSIFEKNFPNQNVIGKISRVKKFVLDKDKLLGFDVIRLVDYKRRFFVSEKIKKIFKKNKFTGYSFVEIELV